MPSWPTTASEPAFQWKWKNLGKPGSIPFTRWSCPKARALSSRTLVANRTPGALAAAEPAEAANWSNPFFEVTT